MSFKANPDFDKEMSHTLEYRQMQLDAANGILEEAQAAGPYRSGHDPTDTLRVVQDGTIVAVCSFDFAGHIVEFGSVNNPPYAPLRRGVRAAGLHLSETPK